MLARRPFSWCPFYAICTKVFILTKIVISSDQWPPATVEVRPSSEIHLSALVKATLGVWAQNKLIWTCVWEPRSNNLRCLKSADLENGKNCKVCLKTMYVRWTSGRCVEIVKERNVWEMVWWMILQLERGLAQIFRWKTSKYFRNILLSKYQNFRKGIRVPKRNSIKDLLR